MDEAVGLLGEYGKEAKIIAGGIDMLGLMKNRVASPKILVNIKKIPDLRYIRENEDGLAIGTLTLINDMQRSDLLKSKYPILCQTAGAIASPQIRNMATVGGNLCQEVRCWYYRRPPDTGISFHCHRKTHNGQCYATEGENQYHAIFGGHSCCAVCPSDMATTLMALNARINTVSPTGGRSIPIDEFYTPLGNTLERGEVITSIQVPGLSPASRQRFIKFSIRKAVDFSVVSAVSSITLENGVVTGARIVLGGVSYKPWRLFNAEEILMGERLSESLAIKAARAGLVDASPLSKNAYKVTIAETLVKRVILDQV